jgi:uncharacterized membrane protein
VTISDSFLPLLIIMAAASFACRAVGFFAMRFVPMTHRLDAALKATPLAVMAGITAITAANGRAPELVALATVIICMKFTNNDLVAALAGVAMAGIIRLTTM